MTEPIHLLSLGAGVQSSTLALMAAAGEVTPMPTAAIFADTGDEPASVYRWLEWLTLRLPFPVHTVSAGRISDVSLSVHVNEETGAGYLRKLIPAFTLNPDGSKGFLGRDCTADHKIKPITAKARELGNVARGEKSVRVIQWIGISLDEVSRMKPSRLPWSQHRWPLIEKEMTRHDCMLWMERNGYPKPPRSACVFCPFHSNAEWNRLKTKEPEEFAKAVDFEKRLQALHANHTGKGRINSTPFLHRSMQPLDTIAFGDDPTQGAMAFINECEGMCGV